MQPNPHRSLRLGVLLGLALLGGALSFASCRVDVPPNAVYPCSTRADCGGGGYTCVLSPGQPGHCCLPTNNGVEICDGIDNDCNGVVDDLAPTPCFESDAGSPDAGQCRAGALQCVDGGAACVGQVLPSPEVCNGLDDDCDGVVDNGFNLTTDTFNCGACNNVCPTNEYCLDGGCATRTETSCSDGIDNDLNGLTDCQDPACLNQSCGTGCLCVSGNPHGRKSEIACADGLDNDSDTLVDCADPDCDGGSCNLDGGCVCVKGVRVETLCFDQLDNNGDTLVDCADPTCAGSACQSDGGAGCLCKNLKPAEVTCSDGIDNDGDGKVDCADSDCLGLKCKSGTTKICRSDGGCQ